MAIKNVQDVAQWRLCTGCGACAWACTEKKVRLQDLVSDGIRPFIEGGPCKDCESECLRYCPGTGLEHEIFTGEIISELATGWGPVLEIWEGHAANDEIRFRGSSGGLASALALYCVERRNMHGVLHAGADENIPWKNKTWLSRSFQEILKRTGSRYSPASPCEGFGEIENAPSPCVFIGKPCDVAALAKAKNLKGELNMNTGVSISIFCAGTPSTLGTIDLLSKNSLSENDLHSLRYRGEGWPGEFRATTKDSNRPGFRKSYKEAWSFLQRYRPLRCHLCPDGTGEFADISCGDPWYREISPGEPGLSLALVRTDLGRKILYGAADAGYIKIKPAGTEALTRSQPNLLEKKGAVWGRTMALRMLGVPAPVFRGFRLLENWMRLPANEKLRSVLGTLRRAVTRGYYTRTRLLVKHSGNPKERPQ